MDAFCEAFAVRPFELFVDDCDGPRLGVNESDSRLKERLKRYVIDSIGRFE
jgi:hypothetical protein